MNWWGHTVKIVWKKRFLSGILEVVFYWKAFTENALKYRSSSSPFDKLIQFNNPKFGFPNRSLFSLDEFLLKLLKCKTHDAFGKIRLKFNLKILCCQKSIPQSCFATAVKVRMIKSNDKLNNVCVMQAEKRAYKCRWLRDAEARLAKLRRLKLINFGSEHLLSRRSKIKNWRVEASSKQFSLNASLSGLKHMLGSARTLGQLSRTIQKDR